jgi:hypothetical protein
MVCRRLCARPLLRSYVESLQLDCFSTTAPSALSQVSRSFYSLIASTLKHLVALHRLDIKMECSDKRTVPLRAWILNGCAFKLRSFGSDFPMGNIMPFLTGQPDIRVLRGTLPYALSPNVLPNLTVLRSHTIMPGWIDDHSVTHLRIYGIPSLRPPANLASVRFLEARQVYPWINALMPDLEVLSSLFNGNWRPVSTSRLLSASPSVQLFGLLAKQKRCCGPMDSHSRPSQETSRHRTL